MRSLFDAVSKLSDIFRCIACCAVRSYSFGPTVNRVSAGRASCLSNHDCDADGTSGEVCWWLYEGCSLGTCMCDPRTHAATDTGRCAVCKFNDNYYFNTFLLLPYIRQHTQNKNTMTEQKYTLLTSFYQSNFITKNKRRLINRAYIIGQNSLHANNNKTRS